MRLLQAIRLPGRPRQIPRTHCWKPFGRRQQPESTGFRSVKRTLEPSPSPNWCASRAPLRKRLVRGFWSTIVSMSPSPRALRVFIWAKCRCRWKRWRNGGAPPAAWNFGSAHRAIRWKRRARPMSLALTTSSSGPFLRRRQKQNSARRKESGGSARCAARCAFQCSRSAASRLKMLIRVLPQAQRGLRRSGCFRNPKMYRPS